MNLKVLKALAEKNDVVISDHDNFQRVPPHYFDSLRQAFEFYFNTFNTKNHSYDHYAEGLSRWPGRATHHEFLDEENTVLCLVAFERFFELYLKNLLWETHGHLSHSRDPKPLPIHQLLIEINAGTFKPKAPDGQPYSSPFSETLIRFYGLFDLQKQGSTDPLVGKFVQVTSQHGFLDSPDHKTSLKLLNWYRDRILHNGNKLPSLWMLDYYITQHLMPIIAEIIRIEKDRLSDSLFYLTTLSKIDLIEKLGNVRFEFDQLHNPQKKEETFRSLLYLGHLKELGRANLKMNLLVRNNIQPTYEYNYKDPIGRGRRFARVEKAEHPNAKEVLTCTCCDVDSMVLYQVNIDGIMQLGKAKKIIEWVKCYTCDYHIRYNVGNPSFFDLRKEKIFSH